MFGTIFSIMITALKVVAAGVGSLFVLGVVLVTIDALRDWAHKVKLEKMNARYSVFIAEALKKGKYRVVGGVFDSSGDRLAAQAWEGKIDSELEKSFKRQHGRLVETL